MNEFIKVSLRADSSNLEKGFAAGQAAVGGFRRSLSLIQGVSARVDSTLKGIGARAAGMSAALLGAMTVSASAATTFETSMRNVNSISKESEGQFKATGSAILDMSREIPIAAKTMADGLYDLASSGFAGSEGLTVLREANIAASAGLTDTAVASKGIAAVLNAYSLDASHAADVSDILFKTVDVGVITFEELAHQLGDFVPLGQAAGIEMDQMGAGMAALTRGGFPAAQAATALTGVMRAFIKPSEAMKEAVTNLGYSNAATLLESRGLQGAIEDLTNATGDNIQEIGQLFQDTEGLRGVLSLTANEGEAFSEALGAIANESSRAGAAQAAYDEQTKATSAKIQLFKNSIFALRTEIGQYYLPILAEVLDRGATVINMFGSLPGPVKAGVAAVLALAQVLTGLGGLLLFMKVRSLIFQKALAGNSIAMKFGVNHAKSFTGVLVGLGKRMEITGRITGRLAATQSFLGTAYTKVRVPISSLGNTMTASGNKMASLGGRAGILGSTVGALGVRFSTAGVAVTSFGNRTGAAGVRLTNFTNRVRAGGRAMTRFGQGIRTTVRAMPMFGAALTGGLMLFEAFSNSAEKGKQKADEFFDELAKGRDMSSIEGLGGTIEEASAKLIDMRANLAGGGKDTFAENLRETYEALNPWASNTISENNAEQKRLGERIEETAAKYENAVAVANTFARATGMSTVEAEKLATTLGVDLTQGLTEADKHNVWLYESSRITRDEFINLMGASGSAAGQLIAAGTAAQNNAFEISNLSEQLAGIRSPLAGVAEDLYTLTDAQKALQQAMMDIGSPTAAWAEALTSKKEAQSKQVDDEIRELERLSEERIRSAEKATEGTQDAIDDEIDAIREAGQARLDAIGNEEGSSAARKRIQNETAAAVEAAQDRMDAARDAGQDNLEAIRDREAETLRQQREDLNATVDEQVLTLAEYAYSLGAQNADLERWAEDTITVASRVGSRVSGYIASMGEDGVELMHLMATGTEDEVKLMKDKILENMELTGDESAVKLSAGMTVAETAARLGAEATRSAIMDELGLLPGDMSYIMDAFGKEIEDGVNSILVGLGQNPISLTQLLSRSSADALERRANPSLAPPPLTTLPPGVSGPVGPQGYTTTPPPLTPGQRRIMSAGGIAQESQGVMFNEPGVGGEAYIPLGRQNLGRSRMLWEETGKILGILPMAAGGLLGFSGGSQAATVTHNTKVEKRSETRFTGPMYLSDAEKVLQYADRKKRLARTRGEG